jgi:hypothetical protein
MAGEAHVARLRGDAQVVTIPLVTGACGGTLANETSKGTVVCAAGAIDVAGLLAWLQRSSASPSESLGSLYGELTLGAAESATGQAVSVSVDRSEQTSGGRGCSGSPSSPGRCLVYGAGAVSLAAGFVAFLSHVAAWSERVDQCGRPERRTSEHAVARETLS